MYGKNFEMSYLPFLTSKQSAFQIFLVGQDELQNEPNFKSVQYSISELYLLNIFEVSAQHERTITVSNLRKL